MSADEFVQQFLQESQENQKSDSDHPPSSSALDDPGSTPTQSAESQLSPSTEIRWIASTKSFRKGEVDLTRNSIGKPESKEEDSEELVRRIPPVEPPMRNGQAKFPVPGPLIHKYIVGQTKFSSKSRHDAVNWEEKPSAIFSRPRVVFLQELPPDTTGGDIIETLEKAADAGKLPQRAWRIAHLRFEPRFGNDKSAAAKVEFLHPQGARAVHELVKMGDFQVRGAMPTSSLIRGPATPKDAPGDSGLGARVSDQDRRDYFTSPARRPLVRRMHLVYG
ncbi:hypothetical protein VMCG_03096 [Cytospora schulzeri]|uniref:Uncharacterized protein n=1 Tax=Cytospora schulzeri TaxID=448051 RepID=A0A423WY43_9PEZI|nr:hypothetical protein VMCG_03096 [Valsa malicola]